MPYVGLTREMTESIALKRRFHCDAAMLFDLLTETRFIQGYTRTKAVSEPKAGGAYRIFEDSITGTFESADKESGLIVLKWRLRNWADEDVSTVKIQLSTQGTLVMRECDTTNLSRSIGAQVHRPWFHRAATQP